MDMGGHELSLEARRTRTAFVKKYILTRRLRFLRYFRLRLRYAFQTQFHPGVWRPPAAKKTTV